MPYHRLDVYQKAYQLALEVHRISLGFPKLEQYGLAQQLRASSKSIAVNLAEGMGKCRRRETLCPDSHWIVRRDQSPVRVCARPGVSGCFAAKRARGALPGSGSDAA